MKTEEKSFTTYEITYSIMSRDTTSFRDYARIDFYLSKKKVGQIQFGSSISPGNNGEIVEKGRRKEIHLYFPLSHFQNIIEILKVGGRRLALYLEVDNNKNGSKNRNNPKNRNDPRNRNNPGMGGITFKSKA